MVAPITSEPERAFFLETQEPTDHFQARCGAALAIRLLSVTRRPRRRSPVEASRPRALAALAAQGGPHPCPTPRSVGGCH